MFRKYQLAVWRSIHNFYSHFSKVTFSRIVEPCLFPFTNQFFFWTVVQTDLQVGHCLSCYPFLLTDLFTFLHWKSSLYITHWPFLFYHWLCYWYSVECLYHADWADTLVHTPETLPSNINHKLDTSGGCDVDNYWIMPF
jgi:hypothetical protein